MPVSKALGYDHHAYLTPIIYNGVTAAGAQGVSAKFVAFTGIQIRGAVTRATTAGTSATTPNIVTISGTTTTTTALTAVTSASTAGFATTLSTALSLNQGDSFWVQNGTDATTVQSVTLEVYPTPGAVLNCP